MAQQNKLICFLLTVLWLMAAAPVAGAKTSVTAITRFTKVLPTATKYKKQDGILYCTLAHNQLIIQVAIEEGSGEDEPDSAALRFAINNKPAGQWIYTGVNEPENELSFYYADITKEYYIIQGSEPNGGVGYDVYYCKGATVAYEGFYIPNSDEYEKYTLSTNGNPGENQILNVSQKDGKPVLTYTDAVYKSVIGLEKYIYEGEGDYTYTGKNLKPLVTAFNWQTGFTPALMYKKALDLNKDDKTEDYTIDWATHTVKFGDPNIKGNLRADFVNHHIFFKSDTLVVKDQAKEGGIEKEINYKFTISKKYNTAVASAYHFYSHAATGAYSATTKKYEVTNVSCNLNEDYFPYEEGTAATLYDFAANKHSYYFQLYYGRKLTLKGLLDILKTPGGKNNYIKCSRKPAEDELRLLLKSEPLTVKNVQQYNDIAYYLQQPENIDADTSSPGYFSSVFLLENIIHAFPDRCVAWLNLADGNWLIKDPQRAGSCYTKYIDLMKSQGKDMNKIPARVYERINTKN